MMTDSVFGHDFWVGVDLAQATFQVSRAVRGVDPATWQRLPQAGFANNETGWADFAQWIQRQSVQLQGRCLGLVAEATGGISRRFAQALAPCVAVPLSIVNPAFVKAFGQSLGQRSKNDKLDAAVLAVFGAVHQPAPAAALSPAQERLRELDRLRQNLVEQQTAWKNSLREARDRIACSLIQEQLCVLERQLRQLEQEIDTIIDEDPPLCRQRTLLDSVPGIGARLAAIVLSELGDLACYSRDELVGYVGMFSRERRSGRHQKRGGGLVKGGGARVRRALALAAMALLRSKSPLKEFDLRLQAAGKSKMCALGALMRKLLLIARAVVKSGKLYAEHEAMRSKPINDPKLA